MNFSLSNFSKGFKQFLFKTFAFLVVFILVSLIIGQGIVSSSLLYEFGIFIYGGMGYILLFSLAGFILLYRDRLTDLPDYKYKLIDFIFLVLGLVLVDLFYIVEINIHLVTANAITIILVHGLFLSMLVSLALGIYGINFVKHFAAKFKKEIIYFFIFGVIAYSLMSQVWHLWPYLSAIVSRVVYHMLLLVNPNARFIQPDILAINGFVAKIAESCSGIYSIFLFTALYLFIIMMDWKKVNKTKAILTFIPALLGAFLVNILRVFSLMLVGGYVSRSLALGLYHSYVGMIFFLIYFSLFWFFAYNWLNNNKDNKLKKKEEMIWKKRG